MVRVRGIKEEGVRTYQFKHVCPSEFGEVNTMYRGNTSSKLRFGAPRTMILEGKMSSMCTPVARTLHSFFLVKWARLLIHGWSLVPMMSTPQRTPKSPLGYNL